jgi:hypothetical protein
MSTHTETPPGEVYPHAWLTLVQHHERRLIAEGTPAEMAYLQAVAFVENHYRDEAFQTARGIGPWHWSATGDGNDLGCGLVRNIVGARKWTPELRLVQCPDCLLEIDRRAATGQADALFAAANPVAIKDATQRYAEHYMIHSLGVPPWATPTGTQGTPLHAFAVQVRQMVARRFRMLGRLCVAVETQQGQAERARGVIAEGDVPSWTLVDPAAAAETAAAFDSLAMLDRMIKQWAETLTLTCTQVDRWLKAEAPSVTADPQGIEGVVAAACDWRDLRSLPGVSRSFADTDGQLVDAVDAYRRGLTVTLDEVSREAFGAPTD